MFPTIRLTGALVLLAALAGCGGQDVYTQLGERQANEMVALLHSAGLEGEKVQQEGGYAVRTSRSDFAQAVRTLNAQGYPRETFDTMGKVFKREGFVSSPLEERARLNHALSQEISNTLASIDGVVMARVHLVVPEHNPLADKPQPAAASVFIKHRPDRDLAAQTSQIKALVVNSVEGLPYDNVTVALFPAESFAPEAMKPGAAGGATPAAQERTTRAAALNTPLLASSAIGLAALLGGGFVWWRRKPVPTSGGALVVREPFELEAGGRPARGPSAVAAAQAQAHAHAQAVQAALRRGNGTR
jgi:type III secretion protein J